MLNPDRTCDHDWTCCVRGSTGGDNIIDQIVLSHKGFSDAEIHVADRSSDYIPMTDHRVVVGFMNIHPPENSNFMASRVKFSMEELVGYGKLCLGYPQSSEKHKFKEFRTMVDEKIKAKSIHNVPVNNDNSFLSRYNALTQIFKECGKATFRRVKRNKHAVNQFVTSPQIQWIQSAIKHLGRALQMTQEHFSGEVSAILLRVYQ
jgi:hypothetical protein